MGTTPANKSRIGMACPRCHTEGTVRVSRLNQEISCKKCGTTFRVTDTGRVLTAAEAETARRVALEGSDALSPWGRTPRWVKVSGFAAGAVLLVLVPTLIWRTPEEIPTDIVGRARAVSESVARDFQGNVKAVASPGTQREVVDWMQRMRPRAWGKRVTSEVPMRIDVRVLFSTPDRCATLAIVLPGAEDAFPLKDAQLLIRGEAAREVNTSDKKREAPPPTARFSEMTLGIFWVKVDGEWLIDGKTTLANARVGSTDQY